MQPTFPHVVTRTPGERKGRAKTAVIAWWCRGTVSRIPGMKLSALAESLGYVAVARFRQGDDHAARVVVARR